MTPGEGLRSFLDVDPRRGLDLELGLDFHLRAGLGLFIRLFQLGVGDGLGGLFADALLAYWEGVVLMTSGAPEVAAWLVLVFYFDRIGAFEAIEGEAHFYGLLEVLRDVPRDHPPSGIQNAAATTSMTNFTAALTSGQEAVPLFWNWLPGKRLRL